MSAADRSTFHAADIISSPANPTVKLARSLHRKRVRQRERAILVEGVRAISSAVEHGVRIRALLFDSDRVDDVDKHMLDPLRSSANRVLLIAHELFAEISETEHPQPIIAICDLPDLQLPNDCSLVLVCDGVRDPGNLGTLIRSAAAAGADGVALLAGCVDPYNPRTVRATAGTLFAVPVQYVRDIPALVEQHFQDSPHIVVADAHAERTYDAHDWGAPTALVVGGEAAGESEITRTYATVVVSIPMQPGIESLNAAMAGSVMLFEAARQRRIAE